MSSLASHASNRPRAPERARETPPSPAATQEECLARSGAGQTEIDEAIRKSLARIDRDEEGVASRLFPFVRGTEGEPKVILMDPKLSFGKPVIVETGIPVSVIVGRYRAGEDPSEIARDYSIPTDHVNDAIRTAIPAAA